MAMNLMSLMYKMFDGIEIPEMIRDLRGKVILHVSDTPSSFYQALDRLIKVLDPPWVIHTGDLADQIKLEIRPNQKELYALKLRRLRSILEYGTHNENRESILVMGNHDSEEIVRSLFRRSRIISRTGEAHIGNLKLNLSHYYFLLEGGDGTFNLYGHDTFYPSEEERVKGVFLNGLLAINLIHMNTGEVYSLPYPRYVDDNRLLKHKTGI